MPSTRIRNYWLIEWKDTKSVKYDDDMQASQVKHQFAVHAWLGNWDAIGAPGDENNVLKVPHEHMVKEHGKTTIDQMTVLDAGGALGYRAQGGLKGDKWNVKADEWETMRDKSIAPSRQGVRWHDRI